MTRGEQIRSKENFDMVKGVFSDAYLFYKKYHGRPPEPGFWDEATKDLGEIMKKYGGETFCGRLMLATFSQLEQETK